MALFHSKHMLLLPSFSASASASSASSSRMAVATYVGVTGLGLTLAFGAFKLFAFWQRTQQKYQAVILSLEQSLSTAQAQALSQEEHVERYKTEVTRLSQRLEGVERDLKASQRREGETSSELKRMEGDKSRLEAEVGNVRKEFGKMGDLLEARTAELKGAEAFLTKADILSGAEVIKLVEGLNGEIMQAAALLSESFVVPEKAGDESSGKEQESDEMRDAISRTEDVVGGRLAELLRSEEHYDDPILVQIAFQAALAAYTHWIVSSWCFENPEDEHMLSEIYARVRESDGAEEQAVSGRWRQLTRTHLQRMVTSSPDLSTDMADAFTQILITAGYGASPAALHQQILDKFSDRIHLIMGMAQQLNKTIGEGITSCDLEVLYIGADIAYNPMTMEDAFGSSPDEGPRSSTPTLSQGAATVPRPASDERVLCTTDLGLVRAEKISGKIGEWNESVLLRPKVILPTSLGIS